MKEEIIKLKDENGNIKEYTILLAFKWFKTNKNYIVYTDKTNNLNGEYEVYASIFDPNDLSVFDSNLTDEEYDEVQRQLDEMSDNND